MTRHHTRHQAVYHHHPSHHHASKAHHHASHHHAHIMPSIGTASKRAYRTVSRDIVKPIWQDVVRPTVRAVDDIPSQAFKTVDNTVDNLTGLFKSPLFLLVGGLLVVKVLTK